MALRIINAGPDPETIVPQIRDAIQAAIAGAEVEVRPASPGHFEIRVTSAAFAGRSGLQRHQLVYGAIAALMKGDAAPVHAVDHLDCRTP
jgi:stress-induced morphogen